MPSVKIGSRVRFTLRGESAVGDVVAIAPAHYVVRVHCVTGGRLRVQRYVVRFSEVVLEVAS